MAIPLDRFSNSALTTLAAGLDNVTNPATMVVASAVGFPVSGSFRVISGTELFQVTAGAGTTNWTVTRQVESTTIATHAIGDAVVHVVTAFEINSLVQTFNVVAYLAKGDGATDDKTPFQNAVNDAHAVTPGGWVFIPTAAYVINSALTTYSNVVFVTYGATFTGAGASSVAPLVNISLLGGLTLPALLTISAGGLAVTGNSTIAGTLGGISTLTATNLGGTLSTAAQANVTSLGTLTSLTTSGTITMTSAVSQLIPGATSFSHRNTANSADNLLIADAGTVTYRADLVLGTAPRILTTGTIPTVGSGGTGTSALSIITGATNTAGQFQVTATGVIAGAVLGIVTFGGAPLATAPKVVLVSLAAPTGGVLTPIVPVADSYTTSGFTINAGNASTTATYIVNYICIF
jgi:hypothetical protein